MNVSIKGLALAALVTFGLAAQQPPPTPPMHAKRAHRLVIKNAMVIYGNAQAAVRPGRHRRAGRADLLHRTGRRRAEPSRAIPTTPRSSDTVIDATGKYVMPGIVNAHMHWHEERQPGMPQPIQYERNLYLAAGVTTAREVGGDFDKSKRWQAESNAHTIIAPRILVYPFVSKGRTGSPAEIRAWIRDIKQQGRRRPEDHRHGSRSARSDHGRGAQARAAHGDAHRGRGDDREGLRRARRQLDRALLRRRGRGAERHPELPARHELLERDPPLRPRRRAVRAGRPGEAAQDHRPDGREARRLGSDVLDLRGQPRPDARAERSPGSRTTSTRRWRSTSRARSTTTARTSSAGPRTQEAKWKQQYRIWMDAVREFASKGGLVTTGDDAGYIYSMYGFGISRELELHEEAGFQPLEVIEHATWNGARLLGMEDRHRQGPRRLHRRSAGRQRQPAREPQAAEPVRRRRDAAQRPAGVELLAARAERQGPERRTAAASSGRSRTASRTTCRR